MGMSQNCLGLEIYCGFSTKMSYFRENERGSEILAKDKEQISTRGSQTLLDIHGILASTRTTRAVRMLRIFRVGRILRPKDGRMDGYGGMVYHVVTLLLVT